MADKVQSRGLTRRLIQVALAVSVLAGSGWGIYQYQRRDQRSHAIASAGEPVNGLKSSTPSAQQERSAAEELKDLLSRDSTLSTKQTVRSAPTPDKLVAESMPAVGDRYARYASDQSLSEKSSQTMFQTTSQSMQTSEISKQNPFSTVPPIVSASESVIANSSSVPDLLEVTRGQEPGNPLRAEVLLPADSPLPSNNRSLVTTPQVPAPVEEARYIFQKDKSETKAGPTSEEVNATLKKARPMVPVAAALSANRYQSVPASANTHSPLDTAQAATQSVRQPSASYAMKVDATRSENPTLTPGLTNKNGTGQPGERLLEGLQNPSITIEKLVPSEIQVGRKCTFAIRVQNTGQQMAQNVAIRDEVPKGTRLLGTAPRAKVNGSNVLWELGPLSAGEERIVEMQLIPTEEGELGSVATVMFATQASAKVLSTRPELVLHVSCSKPKVLAGDQQQLQIEISNPGSGDATGVILLATLPAGISHPAGPALELEVGTLPAGESRQFDLVLRAEQAGPIENLMTVRADANLQAHAVCEFEVIAPQLQVNVKGPEKRFLERPATYQVSIKNPGTAPAKDVQLVTHLPKGLQFVKANNMGEYHAATHSVHWSLPELPASQQGTVELVTLPIEAGAQILQIDTQAGQRLTDHTEKKVYVEGLAELKFEVIDTEDPIEIGGESVYEIRLTNEGSKSAVNVQVAAKMPTGLRAISAEGETEHTIQAEWVEFAPLARLDPKAIVIYRIHVRGTEPGHQRIRVQITTDEIQQPITKEESTRVYADQ